jgi:hypothetical protein
MRCIFKFGNRQLSRDEASLASADRRIKFCFSIGLSLRFLLV